MTLGEILVEIMAAERGQSLARPGALFGPYASGAPAIFIDQVAKMGLDCAILGCVGDDDFGRLNRQRLADDGVDTAQIRVLARQTTGTAFVTYRADGERDFIYHVTNAACANIDPEHVDGTALAGCSLFHVMGSSLFSPPAIRAMQKAVALVKRGGGRVSFDPNVRKEMLAIPETAKALRAIFAQTNVLIPSEGEITRLTAAETEAEAVAESLAAGIDEVVVKKGAAGCRYDDGKIRLDVPGFAVAERDPTGAGDCFGATYLALRAQGRDAATALRYANAAGACAVLEKGPMEGTTTRAEQEAFMRRYDAGAVPDGNR